MILNSKEEKLGIRNIGATVTAIILLSMYFIHDFKMDQQIVNAGIYIIIIIICASVTMEKQFFYESIYTLILMFFLGIFIKNSIPYLNHPDWFNDSFAANLDHIENGSELIQRVLETSYIQFYLLGLLLWFIAKTCKKSFLSTKFIYTMSILGIFSFWALIFHICAAFFLKYRLIETIIFAVFVIGAFWEAFTTKVFQRKSVWELSILVLLMSAIALFYEIPFSNLVSSFKRLYDAEWYYLLGLTLICCICILSEKKKEDNMIGVSILITMLLIFWRKNGSMMFGLEMLLVFHVAAVFMYQCIWNWFCFSKNDKKSIDHRYIYIGSYGVVLLFTILVQLHLMLSAILFIVGIGALLMYYGKHIDIRGKFWGIIFIGVIPWILLEVTMDSLGKLPASRNTVIAATVMFWCVCSIALSWKDSGNMKSIVLKKANAESIIAGMSAIAYFLMIIVLLIEM